MGSPSINSFIIFNKILIPPKSQVELRWNGVGVCGEELSPEMRMDIAMNASVFGLERFAAGRWREREPGLQGEKPKDPA